MCVKSPHDLVLRRLFINVVERDKFPPTFGPFKDEANRRVFPFVRRFLEWAVNFLPPGRFFSRLAGCETLDGIGLAFKDLVCRLLLEKKKTSRERRDNKSATAEGKKQGGGFV